MAVYPFYVETESATRNTPVGCGCRNKLGYQNTKIYQRDNREITTPYEVKQQSIYNTETGEIRLETSIYFQGKCIHSHFTNY